MAGENRFTLFGTPTPEQVRQQINAQGINQDLAIGGVPASRAPAVALAQAGRLLGQGINSTFGGEDPQITRARKLQEAFADASTAGDDQEKYMEALVVALNSRDMFQEAGQALGTLNNLRAQKRKEQAALRKEGREDTQLLINLAKERRETNTALTRAEQQERRIGLESGRLGLSREEFDFNKSVKEGRLDLDRSRLGLDRESLALQRDRLTEMQLQFDLNLASRDELTRQQDRLKVKQDFLKNNPGDITTTREIAEIQGRIDKLNAITGANRFDQKGKNLNLKDKLLSDALFFNGALSDLDRWTNILRKDPTLGGAAGTVRKFVQKSVGATQSLADLFGKDNVPIAESLSKASSDMLRKDDQLGLVDPDVVNKFFSKEVATVPLFENRLAYLIARARKPNEKLAVSDVAVAKKDARVTGITSTEDVIARLEEIRVEFERHYLSIQARQKALFQEDLPITRTTAAPEQGTALTIITVTDEDLKGLQ